MKVFSATDQKVEQVITNAVVLRVVKDVGARAVPRQRDLDDFGEARL